MIKTNKLIKQSYLFFALKVYKQNLVFHTLLVEYYIQPEIG